MAVRQLETGLLGALALSGGVRSQLGPLSDYRYLALPRGLRV